MSLRREPGRGAFVVAFLACLSGCTAGSPLDRAGVTIQLPEGWSPTPLDRWPVPGTPVASWNGPGESSLVVYRGLPIPNGTPESLGLAIETRLTNLPELEVLKRETVTVSGLPAVRLDSKAPGTGQCLAPSGLGTPKLEGTDKLVPTRRIVVAFPRKGDTLVLVWHAPEDGADGLSGQIDTILGTLRVSDRDAVTSTY